MPHTDRERTRRFEDTALDRWTSISKGDKHLHYNPTQGQFIPLYIVYDMYVNGMV